MKINENLILNSAKKQIRDTYLAGYYEMAENLVAGETYTISFEGSWSGGSLAILTQDGYTLIHSNPDYKKIGSRYYFTFKLTKVYEERGKENIISFYNYPNDGGVKSSEIYRVKLEKGTEMTPYVPNVAGVKNNSLYPTKVGGGIWEEIQPV